MKTEFAKYTVNPNTFYVQIIFAKTKLKEPDYITESEMAIEKSPKFTIYFLIRTLFSLPLVSGLQTDKSKKKKMFWYFYRLFLFIF